MEDALVMPNNDFWIKDLNLAPKGTSELDTAMIEMVGLERAVEYFRDKRPLEGARITGCVTVTKETGIFIRALKTLGAKVRWCSDNRYAINDAVSATLATEGIPIFGVANQSEEEYYKCMQYAMRFLDEQKRYIGPTQIIDDGADLTSYLVRYAPSYFDSVIGITEQTTCGINEVKRIITSSDQPPTAIININDAFAKKNFDNYYGVRESLIYALQKAIGLQFSGKNFIVYGYGPVGKGCLEAIKALGGHGFVVETDILKAVEAHMNGFIIVSRKEALSIGQVFLTATGCVNVISKEEILQMQDGAILCNIGHGNSEFDYLGILNSQVISKRQVNTHVMELCLSSMKRVFILCQGALVNMIAGPGNPPMVMSMTFISHLLAQMDIFNNPSKYSEPKIYECGEDFSRKVMRFVFPKIANKLYDLNEEQKLYLNFPEDLTEEDHFL
ncbi:MAG: adenosylhomocysteinase [Gemmatimonadetes bacterium]|nr:adenosylhomocysteinase [Gemmatimonadota bacterium]